jgi:teichuronic acid biosynthesis glycosyltransferase TuaC
VSSRFPDRLRPGLGNFVGRQTLELASRPGIAVQVIAPLGRRPLAGRSALDELPAEESWKGLTVHRPRFTPLPFLPSTRAAALARRLVPFAAGLHRHSPFEIVSAEFSWPDGPAAVAIGRALGIPVAIKARGMEFERNIREPRKRRLLLAAGRSADALLAVSADVKATMVAAGLAAERIQVHYPAVDQDVFRPADGASTRRRLGVDGALLLAVGNLIPEKGQFLAVEALARIEGATLIVAGSGPERESLLRRAARLGVSDRLRLLGSVPNALLPALYNAADVTIHPSLMEGFANARLESLACGTPLVTTAAGEARRILDRPAAGRIVPADSGAIAAAVSALLADPPAPEAVRATVEAYTWERNAAELEAHLRRAVSRA